MKKLLLSAAILTAFVTGANAMMEVDESCPDKHSLFVAIGKIHGDVGGQSFEFADASGKRWRGYNLRELASRVNLGTGAEPIFTHEGSVCHVSYDKKIDTEEGRGKGVATILTLDLEQEK